MKKKHQQTTHAPDILPTYQKIFHAEYLNKHNNG